MYSRIRNFESRLVGSGSVSTLQLPWTRIVKIIFNTFQHVDPGSISTFHFSVFFFSKLLPLVRTHLEWPKPYIKECATSALPGTQRWRVYCTRRTQLESIICFHTPANIHQSDCCFQVQPVFEVVVVVRCFTTESTFTNNRVTKEEQTTPEYN